MLWLGLEVRECGVESSLRGSIGGLGAGFFFLALPNMLPLDKDELDP